MNELTERVISRVPVRSPCFKRMFKTPSLRTRRNTIFHFKCITEVEKQAASACRRKTLPIPEVITNCPNKCELLLLRCLRNNLRAPATSSRWVILPRFQLALRASISFWLPVVKTESTCAITACTSLEQFWAMFRRIGSKYCQKSTIVSTTADDAYAA